MSKPIVIVGEAWGKDEEEARAPFVGASGKMLRGLLRQTGIAISDCYLTNVFNLRPRPTNDISNLCGKREAGIPGMRALSSGKYIRAEFAPELDRLYQEVRNESPNLIIALGGTALWALTGQSSIRANRGTIIHSHLGPKVLPTYHPAAVLRQWSLRPIVIADLQKAAREQHTAEFTRPSREVWTAPTLDDIEEFYNRFILPSDILSIDIETKLDQITEIGFAPDPHHALVIPFWDRERADGNYWRTLREELDAWAWVRKLCTEPRRKLGQNFIYDMKFLWKTVGIPCPNTDDTMLSHHALQPEMEKGLGFLGSIYTDEPSWKMMRKSDTVKKED